MKCFCGCWWRIPDARHHASTPVNFHSDDIVKFDLLTSSYQGASIIPAVEVERESNVRLLSTTLVGAIPRLPCQNSINMEPAQLARSISIQHSFMDWPRLPSDRAVNCLRRPSIRDVNDVPSIRPKLPRTAMWALHTRHVVSEPLTTSDTYCR